MVLTGCIVHGFGVFLYLVDEGMAQGASWTIEVETHLQPNLHTCSLPPSSQCVVLQVLQGNAIYRQGLCDGTKKESPFPNRVPCWQIFINIIFNIFYIYI